MTTHVHMHTCTYTQKLSHANRQKYEQAHNLYMHTYIHTYIHTSYTLY